MNEPRKISSEYAKNVLETWRNKDFPDRRSQAHLKQATSNLKSIKRHEKHAEKVKAAKGKMNQMEQIAARYHKLKGRMGGTAQSRALNIKSS